MRHVTCLINTELGDEADGKMKNLFLQTLSRSKLPQQSGDESTRDV